MNPHRGPAILIMFLAFTGIVSCKARMSGSSTKDGDNTQSSREPTFDEIQNATYQAYHAFYETTKGYDVPPKKGAPDIKEVDYCLSAAPRDWPWQKSQYFCSFPGYGEEIRPHVRACFLNRGTPEVCVGAYSWIRKNQLQIFNYVMGSKISLCNVVYSGTTSGGKGIDSEGRSNTPPREDVDLDAMERAKCEDKCNAVLQQGHFKDFSKAMCQFAGSNIWSEPRPLR